MTSDQLRARDFAHISLLHARDGESVSRAVIEHLDSAARYELHAISVALTNALEAGPVTAGPDIADMIGSVSGSSVTAEAEKELPVTASDALWSTRRINVG